MRGEIAIALLAIVLVAGAGTGYLLGTSNERVNTSVSTTTTTAVTTEHASAISAVLHGDVSLLNVSRTYYWADDVSKDIVIGLPGYSYFLNGSVTFDGVKFETMCPPAYRDCPGSNSSSTTVTAGAIRFNMTFPDGTIETAGDVIGDSIFTLVLSQHQPRAGMLIEYVNDYGNFSNSVDYAVFLLVSSCGKSPYVC
ncbi:MAG TPA: hypothetical protein VEB87_02490 [Nitrososphaerales archaeon]|nr:hypothetical protein [Nitrososphaerales archaeon]